MPDPRTDAKAWQEATKKRARSEPSLQEQPWPKALYTHAKLCDCYDCRYYGRYAKNLDHRSAFQRGFLWGHKYRHGFIVGVICTIFYDAHWGL